jgi:hypothetical protein
MDEKNEALRRRNAQLEEVGLRQPGRGGKGGGKGGGKWAGKGGGKGGHGHHPYAAPGYQQYQPYQQYQQYPPYQQYQQYQQYQAQVPPPPAGQPGGSGAPVPGPTRAGPNAVTCKDWVNGNCKYGQDCRFRHSQ